MSKREEREKQRRRQHRKEFKREVVKRMGESKNILGLGRELGLDVKMMYQWKWKEEGRRYSGNSRQSRALQAAEKV
jgi:transposase-like protein